MKKILVKDESKRFGLNAFKMLGGAYAIAQLLCEKYHLDIETLSFEHLKNAIGEKMTFATTTDGNHGRGVAWAAQQLGQNAVIYMPKRFCSGTRWRHSEPRCRVHRHGYEL